MKKNWCGWHRDFGLVTALTHAMYFNTKGEEVRGVKSGLLVKDRQGRINDLKFEEDEMIFQTGDLSFLLSGGTIISTPHAVKINSDIPDNVYRITFVNFFDPPYDFKIYLPLTLSTQEIYEKDPLNLSNMMTNFKPGFTYKDFILTAMNNYYPQ